MEDFYRKILNLREANLNVEEDINVILNQYFSEYQDTSEGMCYIHTTNIKIMLDQKKIKTYQINSLNLGAHYEHYFLIVDNKEELYLIDPTYLQFDSTNKILINKKLKNFPSDTLKSSKKGLNLYLDLINKKYSKVDVEDITLYLESLETKKIKTLDQLLINLNI